MAMKERNGGDAIWLSAQFGNFVARVPAETPGATKRTNKLNNVIYEKYYSEVSGRLAGMWVSSPPEDHPEYGKSLNVRIKDGEELLIVKFPLSGTYTLGVLSRLPNCDVGSDVVIKIFDKEQGGSKSRVCFIQQNGTTIPPIWSKESKGEGENELPDLICLKAANEKKKTKAIWDDTARLEFLEGFVLRYDAKMNLNKAETAEAPAESDQTNDDLPF